MSADPRTRARIQVVLAGVLWSFSGLFAKALREPTVLALNEPEINSLTMAFFRSLFAGILLLPLLRSASAPPLDRKLLGMVACFATMSVLFLTAMTSGQAADAILLQYTAPAWLLLFGWLTGTERGQRADLLLLLGGLAGVAVIVVGGWGTADPVAIGAALGSGVTYAGVLLFLRWQNDRPAPWLTVANLLGTALVLSPVLLFFPTPTLPQLAWLALFGAVQLAWPYWLMARALRHVPSFEAGLLTLVEPVLNPLWAFLISPKTEQLTASKLIGGALIIGALIIRYWPRRVK